MEELTQQDVAAMSRARSITFFGRVDGVGGIRCEGQGVAEDAFRPVLAFYGDSSTPAHVVGVGSRRSDGPGPAAMVVDRADRDPVWQTVVGQLEPGDRVLLYWTVTAEGDDLRLVVVRTGEPPRTFLVTYTRAVRIEERPQVAELRPAAAKVVEAAAPVVQKRPSPKPRPTPSTLLDKAVSHTATAYLGAGSAGATLAIVLGAPLVTGAALGLGVVRGVLWWRGRRAPEAAVTDRTREAVGSRSGNGQAA